MTHWVKDWEAEAESKKRVGRERNLKDELAKRDDVEASLRLELTKVKKELETALASLQSGKGMENALQAEYEEQLERERQKRVEHLAQVGLRRILQQGLARGWQAWFDMWETHVYQKRLLAQSTARLSKPRLVHAVTHWRVEWETAVAAARFSAKKSALASDVATHESQNAMLRKELAKVQAELNEARKAMAEGRGLEMEKERQMQEQLEVERAKRVEHLANVGLRRMFQQGLARGWSAWHELWSEKVRQTNLLKSSAARLSKPKLVHAVSHWINDYEAEKRYKASLTKSSS